MPERHKSSFTLLSLVCYKPNDWRFLLKASPQHEPPLECAAQDEQFALAWEILRAGIAARAFPGASAAVLSRGRILALKAVGRFTYEPAAPGVIPETIFDLASVTKVVATTAMSMILYERGFLDLDTPVAGILPAFGKGDERRWDVTMRMLLAHSSGLPAYEKLFLRACTRNELVGAALTSPLVSEPGCRTEYSDIGFIILGECLARLADEPLETFCQREVFAPLNMQRTMFNPPPELRMAISPTGDDREFRHRVVQGEVHDENAWVMDGIAGHAGVFAPAYEVLLFAHAMLTGGAPLVRRDTLALFTRRYSLPGTSRALGWDTPSSPSQSGRLFSACSFGHLGFTGTSIWIDPQRALAVVLLTNRTWPDRSSQKIKEVRPRFHDAVVEALGGLGG